MVLEREQGAQRGPGGAVSRRLTLTEGALCTEGAYPRTGHQAALQRGNMQTVAGGTPPSQEQHGDFGHCWGGRVPGCRDLESGDLVMTSSEADALPDTCSCQRRGRPGQTPPVAPSVPSWGLPGAGPGRGRGQEQQAALSLGGKE